MRGVYPSGKTASSNPMPSIQVTALASASITAHPPPLQLRFTTSLTRVPVQTRATSYVKPDHQDLAAWPGSKPSRLVGVYRLSTDQRPNIYPARRSQLHRRSAPPPRDWALWALEGCLPRRSPLGPFWHGQTRVSKTLSPQQAGLASCEQTCLVGRRRADGPRW